MDTNSSWFGTDEEMTGFAYGVHEHLVKSGVTPSSEDYYTKLNGRLREVFPDRFEETDGDDDLKIEVDKPKKATPLKKPIVASARRSGSKARTVRLTATQVALARRLGITAKEYAEELLKGDY
jgi:hypothetical protein